ncbi:MAG TPA: helix-turn-helix transcriptional regulator [Acidimicrobiales bacterium]
MGRDALKRLREELGMSQETLAEEIGAAVSTVASWERGEATPRPRNRRRYAEALDITVDELDAILDADARPNDADIVLDPSWTLGRARDLAAALSTDGGTAPMPSGAAARLVHEWLVTDPPQTVELTAGRRIGDAAVDRVIARTDQLRHLDDYVAGRSLHAAVDREVRATAALVRSASYSDAVGRRLLAALADLCQLAGWTNADAGLHRAAERYYAAGLSAAHAAGDRQLAGQLVSSLAYHLANTGPPRDAVLLAQSAVAGAKAATGVVRALFGERLAWAHARAGDRVETDRALGRVEDAYASPSGDGPEWAYWLDELEIDVMAGRCWTELGVAERARPLLERALAGYDDQRSREAALYLSWLAEAHLLAGDVDEAARTAQRVLALTIATASARSDARLDRLHHLLNPYGAVDEVRDFQDGYRSAGFGQR